MNTKLPGEFYTRCTNSTLVIYGEKGDDKGKEKSGDLAYRSS